VRGFELGAQSRRQRPLAGAVNTFDRDEHAASVARLLADPSALERVPWATSATPASGGTN
jgi:hypothetical protein